MCDTTEYRENDDLTDALIAIGSRLFKIDGDSPDGRRVYDAIEVIRTIEALRRRVAELERDLNAGRELMRTAWSEMNAIRARDGAPSGVSHEWWSAITDQLQHLLKDDAKPWMLGAARLMLERHETNKIKAAEGVRDTYVQIADEYSRKAKSLTAENAELKVERDAYKMRGDGHWGTLKAIREFAREGDCERIILWVGDAASGYVETTEETIGKIQTENAELKRQVEALREERKVSEALYDQLHTMSKTHAFRLCDDGSINAMDLETDDWDILESGPAFDALKVYLEAAKGEVE